MKKKVRQSPLATMHKGVGSVKEIIRNARGSLTQAEFVDFLGDRYGIKTSQGIISKYESGKASPPAGMIDKCMQIIHGRDIESDVTLKALEVRMRKVLGGPAQAGARKAFAVILDSLSDSA